MATVMRAVMEVPLPLVVVPVEAAQPREKAKWGGTVIAGPSLLVGWEACTESATVRTLTPLLPQLQWQL